MNLQNEVIKILYEGNLKPGNHIITWDSIDNNGNKVTPGKYNYKLEAQSSSFVSIRKMIKKDNTQ